VTGNKDYAAFMQQIYHSREQPINKTVRTSGVQDAAKAKDKKFFADEMSDPSFHDFIARSYASDSGYAIRINPRTGEKEMVIAGTRTMGQWGLNLADMVLYGGDKLIDQGVGILKKTIRYETGLNIPTTEHIKFLSRLDRPRQKKEKYYHDIALSNGVDVIYGHSRGGAMAADIARESGATAIGLDAAMSIATNTNTLNLEEGGGANPLGLFDEIIGLTGEDNIHMDLSPWSPHQVWN